MCSAIEAILPLRAGTRKRPDYGYVEVNANSKHWPCLFPQYGPGPKHTRKIELAPWQQSIVNAHSKELLRGLLHSDGCRVMNVAVKHQTQGVRRYHYTRYHFTNHSQDIIRVFCETCERLGIAWKRAKHTDITINRRAVVAFVDTFVGPKR